MIKKYLWNKSLLRLLPIILVFIGVILVIAIFPNQFPVWTGFGEYQNPNGEIDRAKTLWDWMSLLIVPFALAIGAWLLNRSERAGEQWIAQERIHEDALQIYLDRMTELMLKEKLCKSANDDETRSLARSRTITVLRILDGARKGIVATFLYESGLINIVPIIKLNNADISNAQLRKANLSAACLSRSNLMGANLSHARLMDANLSYVRLENANLRSASLLSTNLLSAKCENAKFSRATLVNANLNSADLHKSNLSSIHAVKANLRSAQLREANLQGANLSEAILVRADLSKANLQNVNFAGANLSGANLRQADLRGAILDDVDLSFADLTGARLKYSQLKNAKSLSVAIMMDGNLFSRR